jgi:hypothetical protein
MAADIKRHAGFRAADDELRHMARLYIVARQFFYLFTGEAEKETNMSSVD